MIDHRTSAIVDDVMHFLRTVPSLNTAIDLLPMLTKGRIDSRLHEIVAAHLDADRKAEADRRPKFVI